MDKNVLAFLVASLVVQLGYSQGTETSRESYLHAIVPSTPGDLRELFRYEGGLMPLVKAHWGGPQATLPENSVAAFEHTLQHAYAIMEIDPRMTKDGQIVVFHDATLERTSDGRGAVNSHSLEELKMLRLKDMQGNITQHSIPTLDEVLQWARGKTILVLDQKDVSVEMRVKKIEEHAAESYAMLIVYSFKDAQACYARNKNIMMEVMIPNHAKFEEFDRTGIPWKNIVAFVGHTPPEDNELMARIHAKGACCMAGTSRNLDKQLVNADIQSAAALKKEYRQLLASGVDLIETDMPCELAELLFPKIAVPQAKSKLFVKRAPGE